MTRSFDARLAPFAIAAALAAPWMPAAAQTAPATPATAASAATGALSMAQVLERVAARGYTDVREVERKRSGQYEVKARNARGQSVELHVDARSGEIVREEVRR